jgi:hypothetical protein
LGSSWAACQSLARFRASSICCGGNHSGQRVTSGSILCDARTRGVGRCEIEPLVGFNEILRDATSGPVHDAEMEHGGFIARVHGSSEPGDGLLVALRKFAAVLMQEAELQHGSVVAEFRSFPIQDDRFGPVAVDARRRASSVPQDCRSRSRHLPQLRLEFARGPCDPESHRPDLPMTLRLRRLGLRGRQLTRWLGPLAGNEVQAPSQPAASRKRREL